MTSQADQIQTLINQIDEVLNKTSPRLPWVMTADVTQQRQVLEQTRNYLLSLQQQSGGFGSSLAQVPNQGYQMGQGSVESAQQVLQAVLQEMNYLRVNMMQPLRKDLELLQQQRNALTQEIRQLEAQRQQAIAAPAQVNQQMLDELLQRMMAQMQERLSEQVAQIMADWEAQAAYDRSLPEGSDRPALSPSQRLAQLQMIQSQSDELMLKLDSRLRVIFESLQNNVQGYESSLNQGLDRMNTLGQQGEAMFAALVSRLAHYLGREASSYLQGSGNRASLAGVEGLNPEALRRSLQASDVMLTNAEIDSLLEELTSGESTQQPTREPAAPPAAPGSGSAMDEPDDADFDDLLNLDLDDLDLDATPTDSTGETPFQDDQPLTTIQDDEDDLLLQLDDEDDNITQIQIGEDPAGLTPISGELASAFDLLDQLSTELQEDEPTDTPSAADPEATDASMTASDATAGESANADHELDDFYRSFFGAATGEAAGGFGTDDPLAETDRPPFAQPTAEAESPPRLVEGDAFDPAPFAQPVAEAEAPGGLAREDDFAPPTPEMPPISAEGIATDWDSPDAISPTLEDALFGGEPEPDAAEFAPAMPEDRMSRSLEEFLFSSEDENFPPAFPGVETPANVVPGELTVGQQSPAEEIETISLLSDLIATPDLEAPTPDIEPSDPSNAALEDFGEEDYIAASPDEDLLGALTTEPEAKIDLRLAADTLQQLTQDLSNLEGLDSDDISFLAVDLTAIEDTEQGISAAWATADIRTASPDLDQETDLESDLDFGSDLDQETDLESDLDFGSDLNQETDLDLGLAFDLEPDLEAPATNAPGDAIEGDIESGTEPPETVDHLFDDFADVPDAAADVADEAFDHDLDTALSNALTFENIDDFDLSPDADLGVETPTPTADSLDNDWDSPAPTGGASEGNAFLTELFRSLDDDAIAPEAPRVTNEGLMREAEQAADAMLDDFFADLVPDDPLPVADRITEVEPSLETWLAEDESAEEQVAPPESRDAIAEEPIFLDDLFSQPEAQAAPPARYSTEANLLTLDDFADSLADETAAPAPPEPSSKPSPEPSSKPSPASPDATFIEDLFAPEAPASPPSPVVDRESNAFTLEGLDNLFEDLPDVEAGAPPATPADDPHAIMLEDIFGELPETQFQPPTTERTDEQATVESLNDLFSTELESSSSEEDEKKNNPGKFPGLF